MSTADDRSTAEVARSYVESFATGDPDRVAGWVTDDFVNEHTAALGTGCVGRDEYRSRLPQFLATFAGLRYDVEQVVADDGRAAVAYTMRATHDGHPVELRGVMWIVVRDGRVAKRTDYWDALTFLQQVGRV
ncbi:MAG TPA: nuclear transport factor 2 family protein [Acidimicrobiales bacterium]